jgi:hypothetical protein
MNKKISNLDLIKKYSNIIKNLKERGIIRSNNVTGDLGENYAIEYYSNTPNLPKLQATPPSTRNIDAISVNGERYSIKTITGNNKVTGVFYGLSKPDSKEIDSKKFEFLLIVFLSSNYELERIVELTWEQFLKFKKWHSRMKAWNVGINKKLLNEGNKIFG